MRTTALRRRTLVAGACILTVAVTGCGGEAPADPVTETVTVPPSTESATTSPAPTTTTPVEEDLGWDEIMERAGPAVARISVATCEDQDMGSGFFVDERHIVTAAHVVEGAVTISIQSERETALLAQVVDLDRSRDVALLRTEPQTELAPLTLAAEEPRQGSELAVIGYPLGRYSPLMSEGLVSGEDEPVDYGDRVVEPVFVTNAATNGGNSGGPVLNRLGEVIGLVSGGQDWDSTSENRRPVQGVNFIVPASAFGPLVDEWTYQATPNPPRCAGDEVVDDEVATEPEEQELLPVEILSEHEMAGFFALILHTHGMAINTEQYGTAWEYFTDSQRERLGGLAAWSRDVGPSYWLQILILDVEETSDTTATVSTKLHTEDALPGGWTCTIFTLDYDFVREGGSWLIEKARSRSDPEECTPTLG